MDEAAAAHCGRQPRGGKGDERGGKLLKGEKGEMRKVIVIWSKFFYIYCCVKEVRKSVKKKD